MGTHLLFLTASPILSFLTHSATAKGLFESLGTFQENAYFKAFVVVILPALPSYICWVTSLSSLKVWLTVTCTNPSPVFTSSLPPGAITPHYPGWLFLYPLKLKETNIIFNLLIFISFIKYL